MKLFNTPRLLMLTILTLLGLAVFASLYFANLGQKHKQLASSPNEAQIKQIIEDHLLSNPEIIQKAVQELERRFAEEEKKQQVKVLAENKDLLLNEKYSFHTGNKTGDITVVEFFDYNCGYCRQALNNLVKLLEEDKNVRLVLKEYPILSEASQNAALAALAARKQGKYLEFHQALLKAKGGINAAVVERIGKKIGLDIDQLKKDMQSDEIKQALAKNVEVGQKLGVRGTPTFIINDQVFSEAIPYETMKTIIATIRKTS